MGYVISFGKYLKTLGLDLLLVQLVVLIEVFEHLVSISVVYRRLSSLVAGCSSAIGEHDSLLFYLLDKH